MARKKKRILAAPVATPAPANPATVRTAQNVASRLFATGSDKASVKTDVRYWLHGAAYSWIAVPAVFYLRFHEVGELGWAVTIFFSVYCVLSAAGLHFLARPEYHTPVRMRGDWIDKVATFWLVACAFGPFIGWALTSAIALAPEYWRSAYWARVILSIALPSLMSLALLRYVRGRGAPVMLALLLGVTALPVWSGWGTLQVLLADMETPAEVRPVDR